MKQISIFGALLIAVAMSTLVFGTQAAFGAEAVSKLSWEAPVERVDGTPMSIDEIAEYRLYYNVDGPVDTASKIVTLEAFQTTHGLTLDLTPRAENYVVNFAISAVDTNGAESALSETVSKTFNVDSTAKPSPPTSVTFSIVCGEDCTIQEVTAE